MSKHFESLIRQLLEKGFVFSGVCLLDSGEIAYNLNGFYKSGDVLLFEDSTYIYAQARYAEITVLNDGQNPFDALVGLNYEWWQKSKDRYDGWKIPDSRWLPYFLEKGLVQEQINVTYK